MLKSLVVVTLCSVFIFNSLQVSAGPRVRELPVSARLHEDGLSAGARLLGRGIPGRQVQKFVDSYIKDNDEVLAQVRGRSVQPFTIIDSVMEHYALPQELRYLAVIESDLLPTAVSRVGAKGPWQLMAGTARELGLKVSRRSDERANYYKSTTAAALYLRDLHREFKDWLLVLAAYNAGPAPVYRAIRMAGSRNFWVLERYLPKETRQHVRRFLATEYYFAISEPVIDPIGPVRSVDPLHSIDPVVDPLRSVDPLHSIDPVVDPMHSVVSAVDPVGPALSVNSIVDPLRSVDAVFDPVPDPRMLPKGGLTDKYFYYRL